MKFGPVPLSQAEGCLLAHSVKQDGWALKKGHRLTADDLSRLAGAGVDPVIVARLEADDVHEDEAARRLAEALAGSQVEGGVATTGRMNLFARRAGLACIDAARIHAINAVHESLTVATLLPFEPVTEGQMLATVKVIPYAAPRAAVEKAVALAGGVAAGTGAAIEIAPWRRLGVGLVMTRLPETRATVLAKMRSAVEKRLLPLEGQCVAEAVVPHTAADIASALGQLAARPDIGALLVSGIAATIDRADVVPAGIEGAGGVVLHAGMPVDPGNLLVLGRLGPADRSLPVVGIPTCARSPKLNGFDFVLRRLAAGLAVVPADIMAMGVGGLLGEIPTRPSPRG